MEAQTVGSPGSPSTEDHTTAGAAGAAIEPTVIPPLSSSSGSSDASFRRRGGAFSKMLSSPNIKAGVSLPSPPESPRQVAELRAHSLVPKTFNSPTFCDVCSAFIWGVLKQGYYCTATEVPLSQALQTAKSAQANVMPAPEVRNSLSLSSMSGETESASLPEVTPVLNHAHSSLTPELQVKLENLLMERSRLEMRTELSLAQLRFFEAEKEKKLEQIRILAENKAELIKKVAEAEQRLLDRRCALIRKKDLMQHLTPILTNIKTSSNLLKSAYQSFDALAAQAFSGTAPNASAGLVSPVTSTSNTLPTETTQVLETPLGNEPAELPVYSAPHSPAAQSPRSPHPYPSSPHMDSSTNLMLDLQLASLQAITSKLELSLNTKLFLRSQLDDLGKEMEGLQKGVDSLQLDLCDLLDTTDEFSEKEIELDDSVNKLVAFSNAVENLNGALSLPPTFSQHGRLREEVRSALERLNTSRAAIQPQLGPIGAEFEIAKISSSSFLHTEDIVLVQEEGKSSPLVRAASINKLVEHLTGEGGDDKEFILAFLHTYRLFISPSELLEKLILRYCVTPAIQTAIPTSELLLLQNTKQLPIRQRVLAFLLFWIDRFYHLDFEHKPDLISILRTFAVGPVREAGFPHFVTMLDCILNEAQSSTEHGTQHIAASLSTSRSGAIKLGPKRRQMVHSLSSTEAHMFSPNLATLEVDREDGSTHIPMPEPIVPCNFDLGDITILDIDPLEIARQITIVEHEKEEKEARAPSVLKITQHFNKISHWIHYEILTQNSPEARAKVISHFCAVAARMRDLHNYNGLMEVLAGLSSSAVERMKITWDLVDKHQIESLHHYRMLMLSNYKAYRTELRLIQPPALPYLGVYLTDLTFMEEAPGKIQGGLINFLKYRNIYRIISNLLQHQRVQYALQAVPQLRDWLLNRPEMKQDLSYKVSLDLEPRETVKQWLAQKEAERLGAAKEK